jgi:ketosteroid isomerase-like protein
LGATRELLDPDVVIAVFTGRPGANRQTYHGHEGFFENLGEMTEVFDDFGFEAEEIVENGDRLLVRARVTGRGKASGVEIESLLFHLWTIQDGKAIRFEIYNERDEAEEALNA